MQRNSCPGLWRCSWLIVVGLGLISISCANSRSTVVSPSSDAPAEVRPEAAAAASPPPKSGPGRDPVPVPVRTVPESTGLLEVPPTPPPLPPQPTPTVVVKAGKIVQDWPAPPEAAALVNPVKNNPDAARLGREYYMQRCVDCHGKEGKGNGYLSKSLLKPPTNLASRMVQANSDGELFWKITQGRSPMPANRVRYTDEQRWFIIEFLRTFKP
ncbi:MAG TPA: cytochrome c [Blastocatellia bacterium]|nr:cytochrome c [Blastocatellia bacterium]